MSHRTYVCRCEDVTLDELSGLIDQGVHTVEEIKRVTRCGMGPCQGRTCSNITAQIIAKKTGIPITEIIVTTQRAPIKPIKLGMIAGGEGDA